jgi:hypothetical protein
MRQRRAHARQTLHDGVTVEPWLDESANAAHAITEPGR